MMDSRSSLLVVVGGFLGAGKTTTIVRVARRLRDSGMRVAVVTNDQASGLVDTAIARGTAESVAEIPGGCFCCRFDAFQETLRELVRTVQPDVVLAEAVGSCTDLAATVYQPLRQLAPVSVRLGPLTVVVDGLRLRQVSRLRQLPRLPQTVSYLYDRQLAEADVLLLNKTDSLSPQECDELTQYLTATYPGAAILPISAATGDGLGRWIERLVEMPQAGNRVLDLDYDRYADAEACLGWLNLDGTLVLHDRNVADWIHGVLEHVRWCAGSAGAEVAHVKVWLEATDGVARGHLVASDRPPIVQVTGDPSGSIRVLLNARVAVGPDRLRSWIEQALARGDHATESRFTITSIDAFSPARPVPTYRLLNKN